MSAAVPIFRVRVHMKLASGVCRALLFVYFPIFRVCVIVSWCNFSFVAMYSLSAQASSTRHIKCPARRFILQSLFCAQLCVCVFTCVSLKNQKYSLEMKSNVFHCTSSHTDKIFKPIAQRDRAGSLFNDSNVHSKISGWKFALTLLSCRIKHSN